MVVHLPVLRFVARGRFWMLAPTAAVVAGWVLLMPADSAIGRLTVFGGGASLFTLLFAIPHATSRLIELDRDGRLDQLRLAGHSPGVLLWTLLLGLAAPFLVAALILGLPVMIGPRFQAADYVVIAITWVATLMLSIGSLAMPRGRPVDSRLVTMGLVTIVGMTAALVLGDDRVTPKELFAILANRANSSFAMLATALLIGMGVFIAGVLPLVMRNTARPATTSLPRRIAIQSWHSPAGAAAEFARGARLVVFPSIVAAVITNVTLIVVLWFTTPGASDAYQRFVVQGGASPSQNLELVIVLLTTFVPVLVGAFVISSTNRLDRESGRLEVLRLAPLSPPALLSALTLGQWAPFVIATVLGHVTLRLLSGTSLRVDISPAVATSIVVLVGSIGPLSAIEGWRRRWPLGYLIPVGLGFLTLVGDTWSHVVRQACIAWIPWVVLARTFRQPDEPPLTGLLGVATLAAITVSALWRVSTAAVGFNGGESVAVVGAVALLLVSLIASSPERGSRPWLPGVVAGVVTGVMVSIGPLRAIDGVLLSSVPIAAWLAGLRLHHLAGGGRWSLPLRASAAAALMVSAIMWVNLLMMYFDLEPLSRDLHAWQAFSTRRHGLLLALVLPVTLLIEIVFRARERLSRLVAENDRRPIPPP